MAKSAKEKRGSDENLFSISGASEALGRTRRTITHALQGVKPDAIRSGLKLWSLKRIIAAVNENTRAPILTSTTDSGLRAMFDQLNAADTEMRAISSLEARRAFAKKILLPLLHEVDLAMRRDGRANGELETLTDLRCDQHLRVFLVAGLGPDATGGCDWSPSECWNAYHASYDGDESEEEAA
jgi:hypothetical protein